MNTYEIQEKLIFLGLSENQALVYLSLLQNGLSKAGNMPRYTGLKRGLVYKVLDQLIEMGFAEKHGESGAITFYTPLSPAKLQQFIDEKISIAREAQETFDSIHGNLKSQFNLLSGKPSVQYFEGIDGVKKLYQDINDEGEDILLIRSFLDESHPEMMDIIGPQIDTQIELGIHTRAITPITKGIEKSIKEFDRKRLVDRCVVKEGTLALPSQIIIYGNKVSFTSFKKNIVSSIIQDKDASDSMRILFDHIWEKEQGHHKKYIASIHKKSSK